VPFTSVASGAVVNTLYLVGGKVGIGISNPQAQLAVSTVFSGQKALLQLDNGSAGTANEYDLDFSVMQTVPIGRISLLYPSAGITRLGFWTYGTGAMSQRMGIDENGNVNIGTSACSYGLCVQTGVGKSGTALFQDVTATTGATLVTITPGAAQTAGSTVLDIQALARFGGTNTTAAVAGLIGTTCPAVTCTAAYTWVKAIAADNSVVYFPVWK
jgi:hypothetical protein